MGSWRLNRKSVSGPAFGARRIPTRMISRGNTLSIFNKLKLALHHLHDRGQDRAIPFRVEFVFSRDFRVRCKDPNDGLQCGSDF